MNFEMISSHTFSARLPEITEENVWAALKGLVCHSTARPTNPLEQLVIVDQEMLDSDLPSSPSIRNFLLNRLIIAIITNELAHCRDVFGIAPFLDEDTLATVEVAIVADTNSGSLDLIGWSWLYYGYVRSDLNMMPDFFSDLAHIHTRTLRRYQRYAIRRLTERLIEQEWATRRQLKKQLLYASLPVAALPVLIGRGLALHKAEEFLKGHPPHHVQVIGAAGIGKTAYVQEIVRRLIDCDLIDHLTWISSPRSIIHIRQQLTLALGSSVKNHFLREYINSQRTVVVLDNIDCLHNAAESLEALLADLGNTMVLLTAQALFAFSYGAKYVHLYELSQLDALAYAKELFRMRFVEKGASSTEKEIEAVWDIAGGNPRNIQNTILKQQYTVVASPRRLIARSG